MHPEINGRLTSFHTLCIIISQSSSLLILDSANIQIRFCKHSNPILQTSKSDSANIQIRFCKHPNPILQTFKSDFANIQIRFCKHSNPILQTFKSDFKLWLLWFNLLLCYPPIKNSNLQSQNYFVHFCLLGCHAEQRDTLRSLPVCCNCWYQ